MAGARPKGYIYGAAFKPQTLALIDAVKSVLNEYRDQLPLTARQIFYRLVGQYDYDKTEQAYARLCEALVKARRARIIPFSAIRDDGTVARGGVGWDDVAEWWASQRSSAEGFTLNRTAGQAVMVELWCEAAGMVPQMLRVADDYDVTVYSTGGFSSVTVTHEVAQRVARRNRPTVFLHVGDYDPSGESIFESMTADIHEFVWDDTGDPERFRPERVALTGDQVIDLGLPTAPPKRSDTRSRNWTGETCQAEALSPRQLADLVREAIEAHYDLGVLRDVIEQEAADRDQLIEDVEEILERRRTEGAE